MEGYPRRGAARGAPGRQPGGRVQPRGRVQRAREPRARAPGVQGAPRVLPRVPPRAQGVPPRPGWQSSCPPRPAPAALRAQPPPAFLASAEASTGDPNDPSTLAMAFDTRSATGLGVEGTASSSFFSSVRVSSFLSSSFFLPPNILPNRPTFLLASFIDACF